MPTNITPLNEKGQPHGYWEAYWDNGNLDCKGNYINGKADGFWESYLPNGDIYYKGSYKNGEPIGYWETNFSNLIIEKKFYAN